MSSTACDDQSVPGPPEDLEQICKDIRAKVKDVCVWKRRQNGSYQTVCDHYWYSTNVQFPEDHFTRCPFCGKQIEVKT